MPLVILLVWIGKKFPHPEVMELRVSYGPQRVSRLELVGQLMLSQSRI